MEKRRINAAGAPQPSGGYAQAIEISGAGRMLFVSGQIPVAADGKVPESAEDQMRLAWANVRAQLEAADMKLSDLVKVTIYLADRGDREANRVIRKEVLGELQPALTVVIVGIFDEAWKVEIEAIAAA
ncbi:enamine deaminase RidA (YjgF/YER057c/UK114 family) [Hoeflea marina]|uniref:Enamine deaminase RidA (YjgF/YER057c/UK114 family) n=1 Tax=Hoeflea marina TaxID=274592 RepID=A0A317PMG5_9HYPH|nr:RidA family protein [Hoeflea marina]PWV99263.1 enamine deaminase RidA (YjgF/YER057c/UK114 family) [Hoeflea marina]